MARGRFAGLEPPPACESEDPLMSEPCYPVVVETPHGQVQTDFCARESDGPNNVAETLRNAGWIVFRLRFAAGTWIAHVINSKRSA
jgi:hypothetical protein